MKKAKDMKCYKTLIHKQSLQVSGLYGIPFPSYLPKRFTQLCMESPCWYTTLVHQYGDQNSNKNIWNPLFRQKRFLFARASIRAHKHTVPSKCKLTVFCETSIEDRVGL